jgi:hypothetical protein
MSDEELDKIIEASGDLEDGETGTQRCIEIYCERNGLSEEIAAQAYRRHFNREARAHGIPQSVIDGKTKLSDHFSKDYIDQQCGRNPDPCEDEHAYYKPEPRFK